MWRLEGDEHVCRCGHGSSDHGRERCTARRFIGATMISCDCAAGRNEVEAGEDYLQPLAYLQLAKARAKKFADTRITLTA